MQTTMMPINEPNFDSDYVLDYGDVLQLQLVGQKSLLIDLKINRDGSINIPDIGRVSVAGLSLEKASSLIEGKIESSYIGVDSFISLSNVRDIQIVVSGNVFNPGPYVLNGNSNLFHALTISGGPNEKGSFRNIDLIRSGEVIETIDLYDIFIFGTSSFGKKLRTGDIIFVRPSLAVNGIFGGVKRPAEYELKDKETINDLIRFANGFSYDADKQNIFKEELLNGIVSNKLVSLDNLEDYGLKDGENIYIRKYPVRKVSIQGAVNNPGTYKLNYGDGIKSLVNRAGGYLPNAYEFGGILENRQALQANEFARNELYRSFLATIIRNSTTMQSDTVNSIGDLLLELRDSPVSGRVLTEFNLDLIQEDPSLDTPLQDGDEIFIPEKINHIYVFGEISNQGTAKFEDEFSVSDYINAKGGLSLDADVNNIYILHPNGVSEKIKKKNVFRDGSTKIKIYPGSIIFIPRKANNIFRAQTVQAYATILGNLGVSLASLSVIKD
tara:strand:- start:923 stop:2413 length:1491 start_codon:yes stop_codon:yes gene_type:complete